MTKIRVGLLWGLLIVLCIGILGVWGSFLASEAMPGLRHPFASKKSATYVDSTYDLQIKIASKGLSLWGVAIAPCIDEQGQQIYPLSSLDFKSRGSVVSEGRVFEFNPQNEMLVCRRDGSITVADLPEKGVQVIEKEFVLDIKEFAGLIDSEEEYKK
jgi:hypothetical protein